MRQEKFKRGKEKMMSIAQESGEGQTLIQPEEDDDDGMRKAATVGASVCAVSVTKEDIELHLVACTARGGWQVKVNLIIYHMLCK